MDNENKRLFFAFEVRALWPKKLPKGRMLKESDRHLTVAFIGQANWKKLRPLLETAPLPPIKVGLVGTFDRILFLPPKYPRVAAYHIKWEENRLDFDAYQQTLAKWLTDHGFPIHLHSRSFLPHVTLCRHPFSPRAWRHAFKQAPLFISNFHLYESKPGLIYEPLWTYPIAPPFDSHFFYGENERQLRQHGEAAIRFLQLPSLPKTKKITSEDGILKSPLHLK